MILTLTIKSKNINSLTKFITFFNKVCDQYTLFILAQMLPIKKIKETFALQQSPHINKKSIERFGFTTHSIKIKILTFNYCKLFFVLKHKLLNNFTDISLEIDSNLKKQKIVFGKNAYYDSDKYQFSVLNYLKLIDVLGENYFMSNRLKTK